MYLRRGLTNEEKSKWWGIFLKLLNIALFDLLHERLAAEEVGAQAAGEFARRDEKLIVDDFRKGNGTARGNQMRAPLEHKAAGPECEDGDDNTRGGQSGGAGTEEVGGAGEKKRGAEKGKGRRRKGEGGGVRKE